MQITLVIDVEEVDVKLFSDYLKLVDLLNKYVSTKKESAKKPEGAAHRVLAITAKDEYVFHYRNYSMATPLSLPLVDVLELMEWVLYVEKDIELNK